MESGLQCLLLSSDDKTVRVLRRVLSEIDVDVEHCSEADAALQRITRRRFEAVIVDCTAPQISSAVLKGARSAPANKRAVTVAVLEDQSTNSSQSALKHAFELGAHFVLFKPISLERTRASFRAVRALMKRERRRHVRIPINFPVEIQVEANDSRLTVHTVDLGENGMALKLSNRKLPASFQWQFTLPRTSQAVAGRGEIAWEGDQVAGVRFCDLDSEVAVQLKAWIERQLAGAGPEEVSVSCKLTDLSLNACYLETESPFPVRTRLQLVMKVGELALQVEGLVRVMHPGAGMGLEFTQNTPTQRAKVEEFIEALINSTGAVPDLQVKPDAIDNSAATLSSWKVSADEADPLLSLFHSKAEAPAEVFYSELRKQRGVPAETGVGG
jgi:DNA-binding response OmpR family regulator